MARLTTPADESELSVRELVLKKVKVEAENSWDRGQVERRRGGVGVVFTDEGDMGEVGDDCVDADNVLALLCDRLFNIGELFCRPP